MTTKNNNSPGLQNLTCSKCGAKAVSKSGTQHRRCTAQPSNGSDNVKLRPKRDKLPSIERGKWQ